MRPVRTLAALALRRLARDRLGLMFTLVLPFMVILLVGLAVGGDDGPRDLGLSVPWPSTPEHDRLLEALAARPGLRMVPLAGGDRLARDVRQGLLAGALLPTGGEPVDGVPPVRYLASRDAEDAGAVLAEVQAALTRVATGHDPKVRVEQIGQVGPLDRLPRFGYTAPANLVLFTFITALAASSGFIEARRLGVRRRLFAAPVAAWQVLAGETLGRLGIALAQTLVVVAGAAALFGVRWGDPRGVALVAGLFATVATAAGLLLGAALRTPEQAGVAGPMAGIALGMLGGCMWPLEITGPAMRALGHATPHAWAVDALVELGAGGGPGAVAGEAAALAAFAAVLLPLAVWRLARSPV